MTKRFDSPFVFYNDDTGRVLSNAQLRFFENETTTPQNVYQDIALTLPFSQPVVADAAGIFPDIWLLDETYTVELRDRDGVLVRWTDNVNNTVGLTDTNSPLLTENIVTLKAGTLIDGSTVNYTIGTVINTLGYVVKGDGQAGMYQVVAAGTGTADDGSLIDLSNGLQAALIQIDWQRTISVDGTIDVNLTYGKDGYYIDVQSLTGGPFTITFDTPFNKFGEFRIKANGLTGGDAIKVVSATGDITLTNGQYGVFRYFSAGWQLIEKDLSTV